MVTATPPRPVRADLLDAALAYAARGWHVFPIRPGSKKPATPNHPAHLCDRTDLRCVDGHTGWEARATTDPARITRAWTTRPYGIGIACGPSGLIVIDLDTATDPGHRSGAERLVDVEQRAGRSLPDTHTVRTPSGGWHLYYATPAGSALTNTASRVAPNIDTRATGGYVVAPPTRLDGPDDTYEVVRTVDELPELPAWFVALIAPPTTPPPRSPTRRRRTVGRTQLDRYVAAALDGETTRIRSAVEGTRNHTLFTAAIALGQLTGAGHLDPDHAQAVLLDAAQAHLDAGAYTTRQAHQTIASGLRRGATQPRQLATTTEEAHR